MSVVTNTTVVSNFARIGQLPLLRLTFGTLYLPVEVYEELRTGQEEGYDFLEGIERMVVPFAEEGWLLLTSVSGDEELRRFAELPPSLHAGERSCLAIAAERGWTVLTDDRAARTHAKRLSVPVLGTIGCLLLAIRRGFCTLEQGNTWLAEMIRQGYRSPVTDLSSWLSPPEA
jgi:predicted nucleic acid-binding protein